MPPKGAKGGASKQKGKEEEQRQDALQAVVLADSFEKRFAPFTIEKPRCLLPLANTPLIEYTLEFLRLAGVEEIFIFCGAHTDQVEEYINASKWKHSSSPFSSLTLVRSTATSIGDAMRDLDAGGLITSDFLLVSGDVISNIDIAPALARHRLRREKDKNAIMTMVLREVGQEQRTKPKSSRPIFFIDPQADRCLHYEEIRRKRRGKHYLELDPELLAAHGEIEMRSDLLDCYIDICTPDVLSLWSDNFDYQSMRTSFLFGVLKDYELNGKTIHTHIVKSGYAARVRSLRAYDAITRDIIGRWTYPLTPDCNIVSGQNYTRHQNKVYTEQGVVIERGGLVKKNSIVGAVTRIGESSTISNSVIGRNCRIGSNVSIVDSYLWDDVVVGDNCTIRKAVVADRAFVGRGSSVPAGALISFDVQVPESKAVPEKARYISRRRSSSKDKALSMDLLEYESSDSDAGSEKSSAYSTHLLGLSPTPSFASLSSASTLHSEEFSVASSAELGETQRLDMEDEVETTIQQRDFFGDAAASIYDGLLHKEPADKIRLELVAQRLATDAADAAVRDALVEAFMKRVWGLVEGIGSGPAGAELDGTEVFTEQETPGAAAEKVWGTQAYGWLVKEMGIFDDGELATASKPDQVAVLKRVEASCVGKEKGKAEQVLLFVVKQCLDDKVLQREGVFEWFDKAPEEEVGGSRKLVGKLLEYLRDRSSSEEEESEEESDEESDDE